MQTQDSQRNKSFQSYVMLLSIKKDLLSVRP